MIDAHITDAAALAARCSHHFSMTWHQACLRRSRWNGKSRCGCTRRVRSAREAANAALLSMDGLEPFTAAVSPGVSANLCEALTGFGGSAGHRFQLSMSLAATWQNTVLRRIWMDLPISDYEVAMRAHREMRQVTDRGSLIRRGTRFYLSGPSGFRVLADTELG